MAYRLNRSNWQSDFSGHKKWLYVVDNNNRHYLINHEKKQRFVVGGAGSRNAARVMFGNPIKDVFLTGYAEADVSNIFDPNEMEQIISGRAPVPSFMRGSIPTRDDGLIQNAQEITAGSGRVFTVPEGYRRGGGRDSSPPPVSTQPEPDPAPEPEPRNFKREARALFPSMPAGFIDLYAGAYEEHGDNKDLLWQEIRTDSRYTNYFPGNLDEEGATILDEVQYIEGKKQFQELLSDYGVPADEFEHKWADIVQEEVSINEFARRAQSLYQRVVSQGPAMREQYAEYFSGDISDAALFGSALDPSFNPVEFEQKIRQAQIGAEAGKFGFDLALREATRMARHGLDIPATRQFFGRAKDLLPRLGDLIERHGKPDSEDDFDLTDLEDALILQDPDEVERMERLFAQEAASFSPSRPRNLQQR